MRRALSGRLGRDARWMTFNWRSYIESVFSAYASMNTIKAQAEQCSSPWTSGEDIADLLQPPPYAARGGGGSAVGGSGSGRYSRTSQQRTRSRKRMTSLCFFLLSSSRYLWAPIWWKHSVSQCLFCHCACWECRNRSDTPLRSVSVAVLSRIMTYLVGWRGLSIVVEPDFVKRAGQNSRLWMWTPRSRNAERRGLPPFA